MFNMYFTIIIFKKLHFHSYSLLFFMTKSMNFYSEIPTTKSLDVTFGANSSAAPISVLCDLFVVFNFLLHKCLCAGS